jgi:hypothetical protein
MSRVIVGCFLLVFLPTPAHAQWAVAEVNSAANLLQMGKQVYTSGKQLLTEWNILRQSILQVENQVRNLQRIPAGLNLLDVVGDYGSRIDSLLGQANAISFTLGQAERDFDRLYRTTGGLTAGGMLQQRQQLLEARMGTSRLGVQMQSMRTDLMELYNHLMALLNGSWVASGNLDSQQLALQQQALIFHSQQSAQAMQATAQRLEAQRQAEEITLQQQSMAFYRQATTLAPVGDWRDGPQVEMSVKGSLR